MLRYAGVPILVLAALVARADTAWAQRSARASVSVVVTPPVIAPTMLDRAVTLAVAGFGKGAARLLPAGMRLLAHDPPQPAGSAQRPRSDPLPEPVRRLTLVYAAN